MYEAVMFGYLAGFVKFFFIFSLIIAYDYTSNPFPKSYKLSYKTYKISKTVGLAFVVCLFWPILLILGIIFQSSDY